MHIHVCCMYVCMYIQRVCACMHARCVCCEPSLTGSLRAARCDTGMTPDNRQRSNGCQRAEICSEQTACLFSTSTRERLDNNASVHIHTPHTQRVNYNIHTTCGIIIARSFILRFTKTPQRTSHTTKLPLQTRNRHCCAPQEKLLPACSRTDSWLRKQRAFKARWRTAALVNSSSIRTGAA